MRLGRRVIHVWGLGLFAGETGSVDAGRPHHSWARTACRGRATGGLRRREQQAEASARGSGSPQPMAL